MSYYNRSGKEAGEKCDCQAATAGMAADPAANLLDVRTVNGLEIYTFKSEKYMALMVNDEYRFLMVMTGGHTVKEAITKALDGIKNKEFYPLDENLNRIEGE